MKKTKIIESNFNEKTGISYVTIQTPKGTYTGYSRLQDEDKEYMSQNVGCRYAEIKAHIKMINSEIKENKIQLIAFERFYNNLSNSNKLNKNSYEARKIRKEIYNFKKRIQELENLKTSMHNTLMEAINKRQKNLDSFYKKLAKQKNKISQK